MSYHFRIGGSAVDFLKNYSVQLTVFLVILVLLPWLAGINDAGHRTLIQYPTGTLVVKFEPGIYMQWFGRTTVYNDVLTFDFDKSEAAGEASLDQSGIPVRYQDGGTGTIYGKARFNLPNDEPTMILAHKAFRSNDGIAHKLIKTVTEESMNLTAGLMTSEEAYTEKRGTFIEWSRDQLQNGKYKTKLEQVVDSEVETGKRVIRNIPVIAFDKSGQPIHLDNDLKTYGITVSGYQITDWNFETKTLNQIAAKREATMAIITAKAQAEQAKQEAITAEEKGKAEVIKAKYEKEVEKQRAVTDAEKKKEVAVINAAQKVEVAEQEKLEAEQKKLAAIEYKQEQTLRGEGDAAYKQLVMNADGALAQKLEAWIRVNQLYAEAVAKQKWVPEIQMGAGQGSNGNAAQDLLDLFMIKTAKDLNLDMRIAGEKK
jgi:regulator of protease activity HflC (stomatin/prohibitin superfamily)